MLESFKKVLSYFTAVLIFLVLSIAYFYPLVNGKVLLQADNINTVGMTKELSSYEELTGDQALWTNSVYSGIPSFRLREIQTNNIFSYLNEISGLGLPSNTIAVFFLYMLGFYLFLLSLKIDPRLSIAGAVAFAFGSFNSIIIITGSINEAKTIALIAPVIAGIIYTYDRNRWLGGLFTMIASGMALAYNSYRVLYYLAILVLIVMVVKLIVAFREKSINRFLRSTGVIGAAIILAVLPDITDLWNNIQFEKVSTRGENEIDSSFAGRTVHAKDHAFEMSLGKKETLSFLIPNILGGVSNPLADSEEAMAVVDPALRKIVGEQDRYWGTRSYSGGPVYLGAVVCFLFFLGVFYYKGREKWWLITATILSVLFSWGNNLAWFNDFMFNHFPLYSKFRTGDVTLVLALVSMPALGLLGLKTLFEKPELLKLNAKGFYAAFILTAGVSLLLAVMPETFNDFLTSDEKNFFAEQISKGKDSAQIYTLFRNDLVDARKTLLVSDALRSFFLILLSAVSLYLYGNNKISPAYLTWGITILILIDLWGVDKRYLNNGNYIPKTKAEQLFRQTKADVIIDQDRDKYFKVFSIYTDPFAEVNTSYFHRSIGGNLDVILRRYQDIIDKYLKPYRHQLVYELKKPGAISGDGEALLDHMPVLNMLNAKYIIYNPNITPIFNPNYMDNAWFVKDVDIVSGPEEALNKIAANDLHHVAVVEDEFSDMVEGYDKDSITGHILLSHYAPDNLMYTSTSAQEQLAVFSDIYYPYGWNAYIDGKSVEHFRVNYILRALKIPAGDHTIVFKFEPESYKYGNIIAGVSSAVVLIILILGIYMFVIKKKQ